MDLICTERIVNDCESSESLCRRQQQQQQQQHEPEPIQPIYITATAAISAAAAIDGSSSSSSNSSSHNNNNNINNNNNSSSSSNNNNTNNDGGVEETNAIATAATVSLKPSATTVEAFEAALGQDANMAATGAATSTTAVAQQQQQQQQQQPQHLQSQSHVVYVEQQSTFFQQQQQQPATAITAATTKQEQQQQQQQINRSPSDHVNTATDDPTFLMDRCLENALKAEEKRPQTVCTYFKTIQKDITPPMRKIVAEWMMEVCAEEKCQEEVVLLALNYMDRFLSSKSVRKTHLQILAAACLLLASKLREPSCRALSADLLVFYTDNSIYKDDLIKWELYVLSRLGWDLSSVTPLDFLELLLTRLPICSNKFPDLNVDKVRQHAQAFVSLAAKEHYFSIYSASTIAASSIAAALSGLKWHLRTGQNLRHLLSLLTDLTSVEQDALHECMMKMESIFEEHSRKLQPYLVSVEQQQQQQQQHHHHHHHTQHTQMQHQQSSQQQQQQQQQQHQQQQQQQPPQQQQQQSQYGQPPLLPHHHHHHHHQHQHQLQMPQQAPQSHTQLHNYHHHAHTHVHQHHRHHHHQHQHQQQQHQHPQNHHHHHHAAANFCGKQMLNAAAALMPDLTQTCKMQANVQKDVQDIKF